MDWRTLWYWPTKAPMIHAAKMPSRFLDRREIQIEQMEPGESGYIQGRHLKVDKYSAVFIHTSGVVISEQHYADNISLLTYDFFKITCLEEGFILYIREGQKLKMGEEIHIKHSRHYLPVVDITEIKE